MLEIALILVLAAHLLLVNLAMAGPLGALGLEWVASRSGSREVGEIGRQLAWWSVMALVLAMLLGGVLLLLEFGQQGSQYWATLQTIRPSQLWFAVAELGFYLVTMMGYLWLKGRTRMSRVAQRFLATLAATNLMYHFPPLFTVLSMIATRPELQGKDLDRPTLRSHMFEAEVLARVFHIWLASIAVLGLTMMVCAWRRQRQQPTADNIGSAKVIAWGARLALITTLLQLPVGLWVFSELPSYELLLGSDMVGTVLFAISIVAVLRLMHLLASLSLGDQEPRRILESLAILMTIVTLMTGVLHRVEHPGDTTREEFSIQHSSPRSAWRAELNHILNQPGRSSYAA